MSNNTLVLVVDGTETYFDNAPKYIQHKVRALIAKHNKGKQGNDPVRANFDTPSHATAGGSQKHNYHEAKLLAARWGVAHP